MALSELEIKRGVKTIGWLDGQTSTGSAHPLAVGYRVASGGTES